MVLEFYISEHIPQHNRYFRLKQLLQLDFLHELTRSYYGKYGQKSIDGEVFFNLSLIAHLGNIGSD